MNINVTKEFIDFNTNEAITRPTGNDEEREPYLFRHVIINALMAVEEGIDGEEKLNRYDLAMRVKKDDNVEINEKEVKTLKEIIGNMFPTIIVGQIFPALDG